MNLFIRLYILFSWSGAIFILIAWPMPEYTGDVITWYDKIAHVLLFGVFAAIFAWTLSLFRRVHPAAAGILGFAAAGLYSAACEYIQAYIPGRDVSEYDFYAGVAGAFAGICIFYYIYVYFREKA